MVTLNEIKKLLYKQKPIAHRLHSTLEKFEYFCKLDDGTRIYFSVPVPEMGGIVFQEQEPAQHLIRWIKHEENGST